MGTHKFHGKNRDQFLDKGGVNEVEADKIKEVTDGYYLNNTIEISHFDAITSLNDDNLNSSIKYYYAYPKNLNQRMLFPINIPSTLRGRTIILDEITIYYNTQSGTIDEDFITWVQLRQIEGDGTVTVILNHTADIGNGESGNGNHQIVDVPIELSDKSIYMHLSPWGADNVEDIRFYSAVIKYHIKES